jgi:acyl-coenzyme A synthetase/AMP-(fatty) acid ligase
MSVEKLLEKYRQFDLQTMIETRNGLISYREFLEKVEVSKREFHTEIAKPSVVALHITSVETALVNMLALTILKHVVVPYYKDPLPSRIADLVGHTVKEGEVLLAHAEPHPVFETFLRKGRSGVVISTSGTTGAAKWLLHDFDAIVGKYAKINKSHTLPFIYRLDNVSGLETFLSITSGGGTLLVPESTDPYALNHRIESFTNRSDMLSVTPSYLRLMILGGGLSAFDSVTRINLGGEKLESLEIERIKNHFPQARVYSFYGTSETTSIRTKTLKGTNYISWGEPEVDFKVKNGQLWLRRSAATMVGYLFDAVEFEDWYPTGDLVEHRTDGYYEVTGRLDHKINVGGKKVYPHEVEQVVMGFEGVEQCRVKGIPNPILGQMVVADVVADPSLLLPELRQYCSAHLEDYKVPQKFNILPSLQLSNRLKST